MFIIVQDLQRTQLQKAIFDAHELSRYKQMIINYKAENENRLSEIQGLQVRVLFVRSSNRSLVGGLRHEEAASRGSSQSHQGAKEGLL